MMPSTYLIRPLTAADARAIVSWSYPSPYHIYDLGRDGHDEAAAALLDPANQYYAVDDNHDAEERQKSLVGYCCFGHEGQVPGGDYAESALDIGVGMRPDLTGNGRGEAFTAAVLAFAVERFGQQTLRATVAEFNARSLRVCAKHGFRRTQTFVSTTETPRSFVVLERTA